MNGLFKKGYKHTLDDSDIGEIIPRDSTEYLADKLQRSRLLIDIIKFLVFFKESCNTFKCCLMKIKLKDLSVWSLFV